MILIMEDSATCREQLKHVIGSKFPTETVREAATVTESLPHLGDSKVLVLDWVLEGGLTLEDFGLLRYLELHRLPCVIYTGNVELIPKTDIPIVSKGDITRLLNLIELKLHTQ